MALMKCVTLVGLIAGAGVASGPFNAYGVAPRAHPVAEQAPEASAASPRAWLGVNVRTAPEALVAQLGLDRDQVIVIESVVAGSPAEAAGVERLDLVLGATLRGGEERSLAATLREANPGDRVTLRVLRAGDERKLTVTLGERAASDAAVPAPNVRVDIDEDDDVWAFGTGPDAAAARKQAEEAMRMAQNAIRQAMEQSRQAFGQQGWGEGFNAPAFEMPAMPDFEFEFDHEAFAEEMQRFAEQHAVEMERLQHHLMDRLEPALEAIEVYVERIMAVVSKEAHAALDAPLAKRLGEALEQADIDATAEQVKRAARGFIDELGFNVNDGEMRVSRGVEGMRRALRKAIEEAGIDGEGASFDSIIKWLDDWSATISDEAAEALERLEAELEEHTESLEHFTPQDAPAPPAPPAPKRDATPSLAQQTSGGKA